MFTTTVVNRKYVTLNMLKRIHKNRPTDNFYYYAHNLWKKK